MSTFHHKNYMEYVQISSLCAQVGGILDSDATALSCSEVDYQENTHTQDRIKSVHIVQVGPWYWSYVVFRRLQ